MITVLHHIVVETPPNNAITRSELTFFLRYFPVCVVTDELEVSATPGSLNASLFGFHVKSVVRKIYLLPFLPNLFSCNPI